MKNIFALALLCAPILLQGCETTVYTYGTNYDGGPRWQNLGGWDNGSQVDPFVNNGSQWGGTNDRGLDQGGLGDLTTLPGPADNVMPSRIPMPSGPATAPALPPGGRPIPNASGNMPSGPIPNNPFGTKASLSEPVFADIGLVGETVSFSSNSKPENNPAVLLARDYNIQTSSAKKILEFAQSNDKAKILASYGLEAKDVSSLVAFEKPSHEVLNKIAVKLGEKPSKIDRIMTDFVRDMRAELGPKDSNFNR